MMDLLARFTTARAIRLTRLIPVGLAAFLAVTVATPARAALGVCGGDPVVVLSDGAVVDLDAVVNTSLSDIRGIAYTLHAPAGTVVVAIMSLGPQQTLDVINDTAPRTYTSVTTVATMGGPVGATAITTVTLTGGIIHTASIAGQSGQPLALRLSW